MKGIGDRVTEVLGGGDVEHLKTSVAIVNVAEDAVVWSNEQMISGPDDYRTPLGSDSRIDNCYMNCSCGKCVVSGEQRKRARRYMLC